MASSLYLFRVTANGVHTITVTATDTVNGNHSQDSHQFVIVNGTGGIGTGLRRDDFRNFTFVGSGNGTVLNGNSNNNITVVITGGTGSTTATGQVERWIVGCGPYRQRWKHIHTFPINTTGMNDGSHTITVNATDGQGNHGFITITVLVDNEAPSIAITSPNENDTLANSISIQGAATDAGPKRNG